MRSTTAGLNSKQQFNPQSTTPSAHDNIGLKFGEREDRFEELGMKFGLKEEDFLIVRWGKASYAESLLKIVSSLGNWAESEEDPQTFFCWEWN